MRAPRVLVAILAVALLAGCTNDRLAQDYRQGTTKDYIAGDGSVETFADRGDPVVFAGTTEEGDEFSSADHLGEVLVVNFWYATCPPCRTEAPALEQLSSELADSGVTFIGVNVRDETDTAKAFARSFDVNYPSIIDYPDSSVQLAFSSSIKPNAVPTTLVLDREGRVAARFTGQVTAPYTLRTIASDLAEEQ